MMGYGEETLGEGERTAKKWGGPRALLQYVGGLSVRAKICLKKKAEYPEGEKKKGRKSAAKLLRQMKPSRGATFRNRVGKGGLTLSVMAGKEWALP